MEFHARVGYLACFAAPLQAAAVAALRLEGLSLVDWLASRSAFRREGWWER
jgi:hypothetical protein